MIFFIGRIFLKNAVNPTPSEIPSGINMKNLSGDTELPTTNVIKKRTSSVQTVINLYLFFSKDTFILRNSTISSLSLQILRKNNN